MSILYYFIDEETRKLRPEAAHKVVAQKDHNADVIRVGIPETMNSVDLETSAVRCMYQRPKETEVRSKTATYYDTSGGYLWYDWTLQEGDTAKAGKINFSVCLQHIEGGLLTVDWNTTIGEIHVKTSYHSDDSDEGDETITPTVAQRVAVLETMIQRVASGAPIVVASTSAMTDTEQIYVLSTDGNWYYHNGSAWVAGGTYGAVATDATLTQSGIPADAEAVGDAINAVTSDVEEVQDALEHLDVETDPTLSIDGKPADAKAVGDIINPMRTATDSDTGKALKAKTITNGKVTEWEFGVAGGLNPQAITLLIAILEAGVYTSDQSQHIQDLIIALGGRPVTVEKVGRTLVFSNVDAISSVTQSGTTLVCA